jgi:hypothetical protein
VQSAQSRQCRIDVPGLHITGSQLLLAEHDLLVIRSTLSGEIVDERAEQLCRRDEVAVVHVRCSQVRAGLDDIGIACAELRNR